MKSSQIKDLNAMLEQERQRNTLAIRAKVEELKNLLEDVEKLLRKCLDLDMKISTYRKPVVEENGQIKELRAMLEQEREWNNLAIQAEEEVKNLLEDAKKLSRIARSFRCQSWIERGNSFR